VKLDPADIADAKAMLADIKPKAIEAIENASDEGMDALNDMIQNGVAESQSLGDPIAEMLYRLAVYGIIEALAAQDPT
jgi:hypothetical protein